MRNAAESIIFTVAIYFFYYFNIKSMFNILQNNYLFVYIMVKIQYIGIALKITF